MAVVGDCFWRGILTSAAVAGQAESTEGMDGMDFWLSAGGKGILLVVSFFWVGGGCFVMLTRNGYGRMEGQGCLSDCRRRDARAPCWLQSRKRFVFCGFVLCFRYSCDADAGN
jgi:hypothetical protein